MREDKAYIVCCKLLENLLGTQEFNGAYAMAKYYCCDSVNALHDICVAVVGCTFDEFLKMHGYEELIDE